MSSAILYVAIVAIWACVLIPRWLRRDSCLASSPAASAPEEQVSHNVTAEAEADEEPAPPRRRRGRRDDREDDAEEPRPASGGDREMPPDLAHRRVLSSRRRLLVLLVVLTIGSGALAGTRLAAWWVILPPSVMLLGYLILLRAAARADAERRELARPRLAQAAGRMDAGARVARPAVPPAALRAEIIDISASRGSAIRGRREVQGGHGIQGDQASKEIYDQDADAKPRAVGD